MSNIIGVSLIAIGFILIYTGFKGIPVWATVLSTIRPNTTTG